MCDLKLKAKWRDFSVVLSHICNSKRVLRLRIFSKNGKKTGSHFPPIASTDSFLMRNILSLLIAINICVFLSYGNSVIKCKRTFNVEVIQPHGITECHFYCILRALDISAFSFFSQMTAHIKDVCPCTDVPCKYEHVGCKQKVMGCWLYK